MVTNLILDYRSPNIPVSNIAPFTYKDGETYLSELARLEDYINLTFVGTVNTELNNLITEVVTAITNEQTDNTTAMNNLATFVNEAVATLTSTGIDHAIAGAVDNPASETRAALDTLYALTDVKFAAAVITGTTKTELDAAYAPSDTVSANDSVVNAIIEASGATRATLDGLYASTGAFNDAALDIVISNTGSTSRATLDSLYAPVSEAASNSVVAGFVTVAGDTQTALDARYQAEGTVSDAAVENLIVGPSTTKTELDSLYAPISAGSNADVAGFVTGAGLTKTALDTNYRSWTAPEPGTTYAVRLGSRWVFNSLDDAVRELFSANHIQPWDEIIVIGDSINFLWARFIMDPAYDWTAPEIMFVDDDPAKWAAMAAAWLLTDSAQLRLSGATGVAFTNGRSARWDTTNAKFYRADNDRIVRGAVEVLNDGNAVHNADGSWQLNDTNHNIQFDGFNPSVSADGTDDMVIRINGIMDANQNIGLYLFDSSAGLITGDGSYYDQGRTQVLNGTFDTDEAGGPGNYWPIASDTTGGPVIVDAVINLSHANSALAKTGHLRSKYWDLDTPTVMYTREIELFNKNKVAYNGFVIGFGTNHFTGTVKVDRD